MKDPPISIDQQPPADQPSIQKPSSLFRFTSRNNSSNSIITLKSISSLRQSNEDLSTPTFPQHPAPSSNQDNLSGNVDGLAISKPSSNLSDNDLSETGEDLQKPVDHGLGQSNTVDLGHMNKKENSSTKSLCSTASKDSMHDFYKNQYTAILESDISDVFKKSFTAFPQSTIPSTQYNNSDDIGTNKNPTNIDNLMEREGRNLKKLQINTFFPTLQDSSCERPAKSCAASQNPSIQSYYNSPDKSSHVRTTNHPQQQHPDLLSPNSDFSSSSSCGTPITSMVDDNPAFNYFGNEKHNTFSLGLGCLQESQPSIDSHLFNTIGRSTQRFNLPLSNSSNSITSDHATNMHPSHLSIPLPSSCSSSSCSSLSCTSSDMSSSHIPTHLNASNNNAGSLLFRGEHHKKISPSSILSEQLSIPKFSAPQADLVPSVAKFSNNDLTTTNPIFFDSINLPCEPSHHNIFSSEMGTSSFAFPVLPSKVGEADPQFDGSEYDEFIDLDELIKREKKKKKKGKKKKGKKKLEPTTGGTHGVVGIGLIQAT
ncbi:hypothetical protein DASC09_003370 [Saccharomycopsis crataegensis]|uniref:Uncharacterized protein n=1 Tax=Saccharomycopsis crataegensis TaxID=43959 RepID=A0AAV5QE40_9ASCO|nr:hypothetical protein DASC09_003370 [Saccharomycopsis crataegensis]